MRAARLHAPHDVRIEEVPTPEAGPGEVLVRVRAVAICPSDWRLWEDGHAGGVVPDHPIIQGHEFSGDVVELGEGVPAGLLGARVAVEPSWHCGACDMCRQGSYNVCRNVVFPSFPPRDGALAEYIACPAHSVQPLPEGVSYIQGALTEPLGVAIHALRHAQVRAESAIAIQGAGVIGMCVLLLARRRGVERIAVIEPVEGRRTWPQAAGATLVVGSHRQALAEGFEAEVTLECSGAAGAFEEALLLTRPLGTVVVVGIPHPEQVSFDMSLARRREITAVFSRRSRDTLKEAVALVAKGEIDLSPLPYRVFPLQQAGEAIRLTGEKRGDMLRAIVEP